MSHLVSDTKLVKFYYRHYKLGTQDFCREYGGDVNGLNKFLNGNYESHSARDSLKSFWEKMNTNQMMKSQNEDDDDDNDFNNTFADNNLLSPGRGSSSTTSSSNNSNITGNRSFSSLAEATAQQQQQSSGGPKNESRRVRSLLKNYYGTGDGSDPSANDPLNIDGPSFNLDSYFSSIVKSSSLGQLIQKDNQMVSEIRTLDGDMKTLVYDNYTKFINATDIIKKMKTNVENMEEGMELLSKNMELITNCSEKINSTLSVRRDRIDQLSGLQKLLQKLQFLTALPSSLNHCLAMQAYNQAVKYYNSNSGILKQYSHIPSFQNIQNECDAIMKTMKEKLYERLSSLSTSQTDAVESAEVLMDLLEPVELVRSKYLESRKHHTLSLLNNLENKQVENITNFIKELNSSFLSEYSYNIASFKSLFINRLDGSDSKKERQNSFNELEDFSKDLFNKYLQIAKSKLSSFKDPKEKIIALEIIYSDVSKLGSELSSSEKIINIINSTVHDQIDFYFESLQKTIKEHIYKLNATLNQKKDEALEGSFLQEISDNTSKDIINDIIELFDNLKPFFLPTETKFLSTSYDTMFTKIQVKSQQFFLFLVNIHFLEYLDIINSTPNREQFGSRFLLVLTSICLYIESKGITQVVQTMNDFVSIVKQGTRKELNVFGFNAPDLCKRIKETAQAILTVFTRLSSQKLEKILKKGLESIPNWLVLKEPRDVRSVIDIYLEEIIKLQNEISKLLPMGSVASSGSNISVKSHSRTGSNNGNSGNNSNTNTPDNIRRNSSSTTTNIPSILFEKKQEQVDFNTYSVLISIIRISLKSFVESLRLKTFGTNGYHQIQIDLQFLRLSLYDIFGRNNTTFDNLLQDCENTIAERCTDPLPLQKPIITKIVETKMNKKKNIVNE
ncbi:hypothetical protein DICPUDRAFT_75733 [Dictyostelium purpureum]|uniref:Vacuolar protein sorting-associated protein 51 homolog n=1 Tax=Dictyostelium purpureum TaxID=5786 RepID=F0ZBI6_DICPU|nr:uncharacterized protein DICPUDRAFT_75733 [Dictyostelium purpureum]EGC38671.1 hypothetical protein DICPUDRAFT_75733 [Dictyostelium purpureum]|eukprot:XP_003284767.1 hypothetical protein DICPUDRAFT_75733 [Dictyostelium purpureum]